MNEDKKILLVEDSNIYGETIIKLLQEKLKQECLWIKNLEDLKEVLDREKDNIQIALVDVILPDAPTGEAVDVVLQYEIPVIVITAKFSNDIKELLWHKNIVDYVTKEGSHTLNYLVELIPRIWKNQDIHVLIVEDSLTARLHLRNLLKIHKYQIHEATNGEEALEILAQDKNNIKIVITDYEMPKMDGFTLTQKIREKYSMNEIAIIGLSTLGNSELTTRFIKYGANDFMSKPYESEQLYCRLTQNVKLIEQFDELRELSLKDHLTKLFNRHYFYAVAPKFYESAARQSQSPIIAMLDIDFFKKVNDTYGHDVGDIVLVRIASILQNFFRKSDVVVRFGGEEFVVLANNMNPKMASYVFNKMRTKIEKEIFHHKEKEFSVTISCGVCTEDLGDIDKMLKNADTKLYLAKNGGRNQVIL